MANTESCFALNYCLISLTGILNTKEKKNFNTIIKDNS